MLAITAKSAASSGQIYFYDEIGATLYGSGITATAVSEILKGLKPESPLDIYINSPGGSVFEGLSIFNQLARWPGKKTVHVDGLAASIASVIAMAGDEILMAENALMMIHSASGGIVGTADEMRKYAEALDKVDGTILRTYVARSKVDEPTIAGWMAAETWMTASECVERGFATAATEKKAMNAFFPLLKSFRNTPPAVRKQTFETSALVARMNARADQVMRRRAALHGGRTQLVQRRDA